MLQTQLHFRLIENAWATTVSEHGGFFFLREKKRDNKISKKAETADLAAKRGTGESEEGGEQSD